jgi:hypothetical protein
MCQEEVVDDAAEEVGAPRLHNELHLVHPDRLLVEYMEAHGHVAMIVQDRGVCLVHRRHALGIYTDHRHAVHVLHDPGPLDVPLHGVRLPPEADEGEHRLLHGIVTEDLLDKLLREL